MILLIDNYDSFVYNLARYVAELGLEYTVIRNDQTNLTEIKDSIKPSHIILSPGPGNPDSAGICLELIKQCYQNIPILGVCLGHQAIGQTFGAKITHAKKPMHGKSCLIQHNHTGILANLEQPLKVARYHSLIVDPIDFPHEHLTINATSHENEIMAIQHTQYPVYGVQFHPESILTHCGHNLISNFILNKVNTNKQLINS